MIFDDREIDLLLEIIGNEQSRSVYGSLNVLRKQMELERLKTKVRNLKNMCDDGRWIIWTEMKLLKLRLM